MGIHNRIDNTAINDIWKPTSNSDFGLITSMIMAVKANVLTDILLRWPSDSRAYTLSMIADRTTLTDIPTRNTNAQMLSITSNCDTIRHRLPTTSESNI